MPTQQLTSRFNVDIALPVLPEELISAFLAGIPLRGIVEGQLTISQIETLIRTAREELESLLDLKLHKKRMYETRDFDRNQWSNWGHIKFSYPITEAIKLYGYYNFGKQIEYPITWLSVKRNMEIPQRNLYIIPGQDVNESPNSADAFSIIYNSRSLLLWGGSNPDYIPNYWRFDYITGFDVLPYDIFQAICKFASIQVLAVMGDISFGAGVASLSLSMDGLSQSLNTTQSAENSLYSARIKQYASELKEDLKRLRSKYTGIRFTVL